MEIIRINDAQGDILQQIIDLEKQAFEGDGNVDLWIIKALIKYGLVYLLKEDEKIISIIEYMQNYNDKSVFMYGLSTIKSKRNQGYAKKILKFTEEILIKDKIEKIYLTVDPKNDVAIQLYKDLGYEIDSFHNDEYGEGIDRYTMSKTLSKK